MCFANVVHCGGISGFSRYGTEFAVTEFADGMELLDDYRPVYDILFVCLSVIVYHNLTYGFFFRYPCFEAIFGQVFQGVAMMKIMSIGKRW